MSSATYIRARSGVNVLITPSSTVRDDRISYRAAGVLSRLLDNVEGYGMTAEQLANGKAREGRDAVRTALHELEGAGYILRRAIKQLNGSFKGWMMYVYDTPAAATGKPENPLADFPAAGNPPQKSSKSTTKSKSITSSSIARARDPAAGAAAAGKNEKKKARRVRPSGLVCWTDDDPQAAASVELDATPGEVQAAVAAVAATGKDPVPGLVAREIQRARAEREKGARAKAREEAGALAEARRRAAERQRLIDDPSERRAAADAIGRVGALFGWREV